MAKPPTMHSAYPADLFDGYCRMTFAEFIALDFTQKHAWEDECLRNELLLDHMPATKAGYCEWATQVGHQLISVGWAWFESGDSRLRVAPGGVSSNVMLVTPKHYDLGALTTGVLLESWLSGGDWQQRVLRSATGVFQPVELKNH